MTRVVGAEGATFERFGRGIAVDFYLGLSGLEILFNSYFYSMVEYVWQLLVKVVEDALVGDATFRMLFWAS